MLVFFLNVSALAIYGDNNNNVTDEYNNSQYCFNGKSKDKVPLVHTKDGENSIFEKNITVFKEWKPF